MQRVVAGKESGSVLVPAQDELAVMGVMSGSIEVEGTLWINFEGSASGPVVVRNGGQVIVDGALTGPVTVEQGGHMLVAPTGSSRGSLVNHGVVRVAGVISSECTGIAPVFDGSGQRVQKTDG